jgi:putative FmdB family regulatory protein
VLKEKLDKMPTYTYQCDKCHHKFELFFTIAQYKENPQCAHCKASQTYRSYQDDLTNMAASVIKTDSELKTLGDLANRNRDRMSEDQKQALHTKHNAYRDTGPLSDLPSGMTRMQKSKGTKWT